MVHQLRALECLYHSAHRVFGGKSAPKAMLHIKRPTTSMHLTGLDFSIFYSSFLVVFSVRSSMSANSVN